jgi:hypothetical protein
MVRAIAADCTALQHLILRGDASPEALAGLSKIKSLNQFDFGRMTDKPIPLSVAQCQAIGSIKSLTSLGVSDCALTDEHVKALAGLKLKTLNMNRNREITDASIPAFLGFTDMENLSIGSSRVTLAGVMKFAALKKLKTLSVGGLSVEDLTKLKTALPGVTVQ